MTTTAPETITTSKGHTVSIDVVGSPACAMPQYASYSHKYFLVSGSHGLASADTYQEVLDRLDTWAQPGARIVRVPRVPYYDTLTGPYDSGRVVGRAPWPGGTWGGRCGSMVWFVDADRRYQDTYGFLHALDPSVCYIQDGRFANREAGLTQAWWINGVADRHPELDGFWVECDQSMRHPGECTGVDLTWDWRDYAPCAPSAG